MKPYSHYCSTSTKQALDDDEVLRALKYTTAGSGLGAGAGLISALLLESLKDPNEAQYLRKALQGAGLGALVGGGAGGIFALNTNGRRSSDFGIYTGPRESLRGVGIPAGEGTLRSGKSTGNFYDNLAQASESIHSPSTTPQR